MDGSQAVSMLDSATLPIRELALLAKRESHRPRPVYAAHKWFARRFGTAMRALLVAYNTAPDEDFWTQFHGGADLTGLAVADLFIGGGTSLYEAHRLGANVVGVDIDPVACMVTSFELTAHTQPDPLETLETMLDMAQAQRLLYRTWVDGVEREALHYFWVQQVDCGGCTLTFDAHPAYLVANAGTQQWMVCAHCGQLQLKPAGATRFLCECGRTTRVAGGTLAQGRASCPQCGHEEQLIDLARRLGRPRYRMFAIESVPLERARRTVPIRDRTFHRPTAEDIDLYAQASVTLAQERGNLPTRAIPAENRSDTRLNSYGYTRYTDLFNDRQLLHLARLMGHIQELPAEHRASYAIALSNHLTSNCMLTRYSAAYRQATPLFSMRAFTHSARPVELNPWLRGTGRGTFPNAVRKVSNAIAFAKAPLELSLDGFVAVPMRAGTADARVINGDSRSVPEIADASADLVLTDPPYLDNIDYSELSDFFVPWLAATGQLVDPGGPSPKSLAAKRRAGDSVTTFRDGLTACFAEGARILSPDGRLVFTFQHQSDAAWESLGRALSGSGLVVVNVFPMQGDSEQSPHRHAQSTTWDAVFVLRHRRAGETPYGVAQLQDAAHFDSCRASAQSWAERLGLSDANAANLARAIVSAGAVGYLAQLAAPRDGLPLLQALQRLAVVDVPDPVDVSA